MMKVIKYLFLIMVLVVTACLKEEVVDGKKEVIFESSFESLTDTTGWRGYCSINVVDDASPGGGNKSLAVSCGCLAPHAYLKLDAREEDSKLLVSAWAKVYGLGGNVGLSASENNFHINGFSAQDTTWQFYQSPDTLFCPAGEGPVIHISAGGIAGGIVYVDLLEVRGVE